MTAPLILPSNRLPAPATTDAPRTDFVEVARLLDALLVYPPASGAGVVARVEKATASDLRQAGAAYGRRRDVSVWVSLSEKVGLPLALLLGRRHAPHVLMAHNLTSPRKHALQQRTGYLGRFARVVVQCREQERYLLAVARLPADRVRFVYGMVDHHFWTPGAATGEPYILSVGQEQRDYPTLVAAARLLPQTRFVVVASSLWARAGGIATDDLPPNVCVERGLSWVALRERYRGASAVVVPLLAGTRYAAGLNGVLEAMATGKPVLVTRTPGIADYADADENALVVPPADPAALAAAIQRLGGDAALSDRLARCARQTVDAGRNLQTYAQALAQIVREAESEGQA